MKTGSLTAALAALGALAATIPTPGAAQSQSYQAEGVATIAAGSINPPSPVEGCDRAKQNAKQKAANAGFNGRVEWEHLSTDSDCRLQTTGGRTTGYFYIFTARGAFYK